MIKKNGIYFITVKFRRNIDGQLDVENWFPAAQVHAGVYIMQDVILAGGRGAAEEKMNGFSIC